MRRARSRANSVRANPAAAALVVASLDLGDRLEARWLPLFGIAFDARGDVLEVALDGVGHSILSPSQIVLEESERGLVAVEIMSADDTVDTLRFREPLRLDHGESTL